MDYTDAETFENTDVRFAALKLITEQINETTVHVSVEYNRKGVVQRKPIDSVSAYRDDTEEHVVNIELRLTGYDNETFNMLDALALSELATRANRDREITKRDEKIACLEAELASFKNPNLWLPGDPSIPVPGKSNNYVDGECIVRGLDLNQIAAEEAERAETNDAITDAAERSFGC